MPTVAAITATSVALRIPFAPNSAPHATALPSPPANATLPLSTPYATGTPSTDATPIPIAF